MSPAPAFIYPLDHRDALIRSSDDSEFLPAANNGQESETDSVDNYLALLSARQIKSASNNPGAVPFEPGDHTRDTQSLVQYRSSVNGGYGEPFNAAPLETSLNAERPPKEHAQGAKSKCKLFASALWKSTCIDASQSDFPGILSIDHFVSQTNSVNSKGQLVKSIKDMTCQSYAKLVNRSHMQRWDECQIPITEYAPTRSTD
ncbi:uncharacterized protein FMAN_15309 [Fusarium mangiferae]|uniref:Uncharacterized protein n=1 Tax=Fusarium mangiferae TaxID=192010 RepID=A0A1L7U8W7_FUSMA|nr:uncharacterized protein FMAN_15309 [Fusarium mangiferae]CVL07178.1 uncharacterized protein FMAN_15309 [Fusarium mangiferae]